MARIDIRAVMKLVKFGSPKTNVKFFRETDKSVFPVIILLWENVPAFQARFDR